LKFAFESRATSRGGGKEGRLAPARPATPSRGCAARVAGPECTNVLEDRKRRPDAAPDPDRRPLVNRRIEPVGLGLLHEQVIEVHIADGREHGLAQPRVLALHAFEQCLHLLPLGIRQRAT